MEFKINMTKINKLFDNFTKDNFTYDYRLDNLKINENLSKNYKDILNLKKDKFLAYLKQENVVCCVRDININILTVKDEIIELDSCFVLEKQYSIIASEKYNCKLTLSPINDSYEIKDIVLSTEEGVLNYGFYLVDLLQKRIRIAKPAGNNITLGLMVRNEANKFIRRMLTHAMKYVANIVILDDASTDNTVEVCEEVLKDFPHKIYKNNEPMIINLKESEIKQKIWNLTTKENPDWILLLDADEIFEDWGITVLPQIVNDIQFDSYGFKIYHMWEDDKHYRVDGIWNPLNYNIFLMRYQPNYEYEWYHKGLHCPRQPHVFDMPGCNCYVKLRHYGHFTKEIRRTKYERYTTLDPNGVFEEKAYYNSMLEENPALELFNNHIF